ncbi:two pore domain potassium channel family protein [Rhodosalinus halophilus]|uniref:Two pore domain potassium channel family protein n=1 Tax=Rhodosalinus halophilus TaxID=2259333 RepID=A0A365U5R6_9RHOB|nr:potassium channel family protein [Rhodosalinus halophilus]RBI83732.1 two pore domain potassium channel family protein [Rhodosalinus halophilus]
MTRPGPFHAFVLLFSGVWSALKDPRVRWLGAIAGTLVASATVIFRYLEGWGWIDALFFAVVTISTVGYGDIVPQTPLGRLLTVVYIVLGIGVFVAAATALGDQLLRRARELDERDEGPATQPRQKEDDP